MTNTKEEIQAARDAINLVLKSKASEISWEDVVDVLAPHWRTLRSVLDDALATISKAETVGEEKDYTSPLRPKRLEYTMCGKIYAVQDNGERHMFMDVRGWGYLTGGGAKKLPYEEAASIQDKWAQEVVELWNTRAEPQGVDVDNEQWRGIAKLIEEQGEVLQLLGKLIAYPDGNHPDGKGDLRNRLQDELADLGAARRYFMAENHFDTLSIINREESKFQQFTKWVMAGIKTPTPPNVTKQLAEALHTVLQTTNKTEGDCADRLRTIKMVVLKALSDMQQQAGTR